MGIMARLRNLESEYAANPSFNVNNAFYCDPNLGDDDNNGRSWEAPFATITAAVAAVLARGKHNWGILCAPGQYDETVTIARTVPSGGIIQGMGGRGSAFIEPSTEDAGGMVCHQDDITLVNLGVAAEDETSAVALTVTGARFRAIGCKIEGGAKQVVIGPGTDAQITAETHGDGADGYFLDCEFCWGTHGIFITASDYGAVTQLRVRGSRFHDLTASSFEETGGSVDIRYRGLVIDGNVFELSEDGSAPTKWVSLNDDNGNKGIASGNYFPVAINSGNNLVSTGVPWIGNYHTGGIAAAQPS